MESFTKDPDATLDYAYNWASWLAEGETISSASVIVQAGITLDSESNTTTTTTAWLSGGSLNETYQVTFRVTTSAGRTDDRSIRVLILDR
jgi:hypothetical protein